MVKNNKTRFFYVLYFDKTWVFDQSERAQGPIYIIKSNKLSYMDVSIMNVHLNTSLVIVSEANEKCSILNLFVYTYSLSEGELIVAITFEPQSVHDSGIQPNHQYHGRHYNGYPERKMSFEYPFLFNPRHTGIILYDKGQVWYLDYQREDPRTRNDHLRYQSIKLLR